MKKLENMQILKNIAVLLVVLGHAGCIYAGIWSETLINNDSEEIKYITRYIYSIHMPLFVFISGYIYNFMRVELFKYNNIKKFIASKFKRLIIPYLIVGITFMIPVQTLFNVYTDNNSFIERAFNEILLAKHPGHLWYLIMLFNIFVIFRIMEDKINKNNYILNLTFLFVLNIISILVPNILQISSTMRYLLYFYLGYISCEKSQNLLKYKWTNLFIIHFVLFNFSYFILGNICNYKFIKAIKWIVDILVAIVGIMCMYILSNKFVDNDSMKIKVIKTSMYKAIDKNNFNIYLFHQPIMLSLISILKIYDIQPCIMYIILFTLTLVFSIKVSVIIYKLKSSINKILKIKEIN